MNEYTFEIIGEVTVYAESEKEAEKKAKRALKEEPEDYVIWNLNMVVKNLK